VCIRMTSSVAVFVVAHKAYRKVVILLFAQNVGT
jgi:hypothetical protein